MKTSNSDETPKQEPATTIVGGRPSGAAQTTHDIPRGLEVLLKKAAVDAAFRQLLLEKRSAAGRVIGLEMDPAETMMLDGMPVQQLDAIIRATRVPAEDRRVFLGQVAALMLAALGMEASGCRKAPSTGIRPGTESSPSGAKSAGIRPGTRRPQNPAPQPADEVSPKSTSDATEASAQSDPNRPVAE